jgi:hypothetical protein
MKKKLSKFSDFDPIESKKKKKPKFNPKDDPSRKNKKYFINMEK